MQCASCQAVYSNLLESCPRCRNSATAKASTADSAVHDGYTTPRRSAVAAPQVSTAAHNSVRSTMTTMTSTLIEFPGAARPQQPAWRKQLSERVREIQERRAREAGHGEAMRLPKSNALPVSAHESSAAAQLGLVPATEEQPVNPIVAAALRRIERARQIPPQPSSTPIAASPSASPIPPAPSPSPVPPTTEVPSSPVASLAVAPKPPTNAHRSLAPQTAAEPQLTTARVDASTSNGVASNGASPTPAPPQTNGKSLKPITRGVDVNSPAYLKHKQEEEARNRAKLLGAKQLIAKQVTMPPARAMSSAATAGATRASAALAAEIAEPAPVEHRQQASDSTAPRQSNLSSLRTARRPVRETTRPATAIPTSNETSSEALQPAARRVTTEILDEATLARREAEEAAAEAARLRKSPNDYAPFTARIAGGMIDALAIAFICSPIAAAFELGYGNWSDTRIVLAMTLSVATITFLYIAAATTFAGRTWGMSLFNLRTVDVESGMAPTAEQSVRRGVAYVFSLLVFGLGFFYALIDPEGRGAHDHLSGTVVINE